MPHVEVRRVKRHAVRQQQVLELRALIGDGVAEEEAAPFGSVCMQVNVVPEGFALCQCQQETSTSHIKVHTQVRTYTD